MSTPHITLQEYETAERTMAQEAATVGLRVHSIVTVLVGAGLIIINITLAPAFPWSAFAVGGMLIGLLAHWWFGYAKLDHQVSEQQRKTEARAENMR